MKEAVIARLRELLQHDDISVIRTNIKEVRNNFREARRNWANQLREEFKEKGGDLAEFELPEDPIDDQYGELIKQFNTRMDEHKKAIAADIKQRITDKTAVMEELKQFVAELDMTNIGALFNQLNAIQDKWKAIKNPNQDNEDFKPIRMAYSHQLDKFYHQVNLAKEMREEDQKRNLEAKKAIIEQVKPLTERDDIRAVEDAVKKLQKQWKKIGNIPQDVREEVNQNYKDLLDSIYTKIQAFYDNRREGMRENLRLKIALCEKVNTINEESAELNSHKQWQEQTDAVFAIQKEWKAVGYSQDNEIVWQVFRNACDTFFDNKQAFYKKLDEGREANKIEKLKLCEAAEALQDSTDWKNTTNSLIQLQKDWKQVGPASRKDENKLWERFRAACDKFFDTKKAHFADKDELEAENLKKKQELVERIKAFDIMEHLDAGFDKLKEFQDEWRTIGYVPLRQKDTIRKDYDTALDEKYAILKANRREVSNQRYQERITERYQDNGSRGMRSEKQKLRDLIQKLKEEIIQYENNLGFFSNAKGNNPMLKTVNDKIRSLKGELADVTAKLRLLIDTEKKMEAEAEAAKAAEAEATTATEAEVDTETGTSASE